MTFPLAPASGHRHLIPLLRQRMATAPGRTLVTQGSQSWSAEDLMQRGELVARAFAAAGVKPGDRVALQSTNRPEFLAVLVASALAGTVLVPINTASRGSQLAYYVKNSRARLFITEASLLAQLESAREVDGAALESVESVWCFDACTPNERLPRLIALTDVPRASQAASHAPDAAATALIMYTSGTSGPSKGVLCSHAQLYWWGHHSLENIGIAESDVLFTCLPLFHVNALNTFYQALMSGGTIVLGGKFSVSRFYDELAQANATVTYLLGAMVPMLLSRTPDASERAHSVRVALAPGALAAHYPAFQSRTGITLLDGYGSTETNFAICTCRQDPRPGWMGTLARGFQARVVDADDQEVPHGTPGELLLRNDEPYAFSSGYFEMPEKTVEAWRNLWFHTGDRVVRDETGQFRFLDRIKDSIRRRGENISSYEVEQAIGTFPSVASVAAFAVPSELAEDEVMCAMELKEGAHFEPLALVKWAEARLPYFAVPRYLRVMNELPKTENGKVQKYKLRQEGRTPDTWDLAGSGHVIQR